jgi:predicted PurR-regulated permease PerM
LPRLSLGRCLRAAVTASIVLGAVILLGRVRAILIPFLLAAVLAYALEGPVRFLTHRRVPRVVAILIVYAMLVSGIGLVVISVVPDLAAELSGLGESFPGYIQSVEDAITSLQVRYTRTPLPQSLRQVIDESIGQIEIRGSAYITGVAAAVPGVLTSLPGLILAPFLAFYLSKDLGKIRDWFLSVVPPESRETCLGLLHDVDRALGGFIRGQLTVAVIVGGLWAIGLSYLGLRFSLLLGIIAGLGEFIPYFGPFLALMPALGLALLTSPALAVKVAVLYVVVQQVEGAVIVPKVMGDSVGLHPLTIVFALLAGQELAGFAGLLLAVPTTAVLKVLLTRLIQTVNRPLTEIEPMMITPTGAKAGVGAAVARTAEANASVAARSARDGSAEAARRGTKGRPAGGGAAPRAGGARGRPAPSRPFPPRQPSRPPAAPSGARGRFPPSTAPPTDRGRRR